MVDRSINVDHLCPGAERSSSELSSNMCFLVLLPHSLPNSSDTFLPKKWKATEWERESQTPVRQWNQTKKKWVGPDGDRTHGLQIWHSNHWATETPQPKLNHHIQLGYHRTANNVAIAWLSGCSNPKPGMARDGCPRCQQLSAVRWYEVECCGLGVGSQ